MCLILFAYNVHPEFRLVVAANRDEFYDRPTASLDFWDDKPEILAGKDLKSGGTWMGVTRSGRFAAITNFRDPESVITNAPSRGHLVVDFLNDTVTPSGYLKTLSENGRRYNGFNLIIGDGNGLFYYSNRQPVIQKIDPGIHGLSNRFLDTPWPKVTAGKTGFEKAVLKSEIQPEMILDFLADTHRYPDKQLPDTGVGIEKERMLSPIFIKSNVYGTRLSSVILVEKSGKTTFIERSFRSPPSGNVEKFEKKFVL